MPMDARNSSLGFSLIELVVILAIISILALASAEHLLHGFKRMRANSELTSATNSFIQAAHFARNQAIANQEFVTIAPLCENRWDSGWIVYLHPTLNFNGEIPSENILLQHVISKDISSTYPESGPKSKPKTYSIPSSPKKPYSGNDFEDISVKAIHRPCQNSDTLTTLTPNRTISNRAKHISFNPAGGAQMKNGGLIANRLIFWSYEFEDLEQQIIMGAGGRLRICIPSVENSQCR